MDELEHVIESAYQDMQGVMAGRKGYRLRHRELAERLQVIITKREKALLDNFVDDIGAVTWNGSAGLTYDDVKYIRDKYIQSAINNLGRE